MTMVYKVGLRYDNQTSLFSSRFIYDKIVSKDYSTLDLLSKIQQHGVVFMRRHQLMIIFLSQAYSFISINLLVSYVWREIAQRSFHGLQLG